MELWWAEKCLRMHNTLNLEAGEQQKQKIMSDSSSFRQKQKAEAAVEAESFKPDSWRPNNCSLDSWILIYAEEYW